MIRAFSFLLLCFMLSSCKTTTDPVELRVLKLGGIAPSDDPRIFSPSFISKDSIYEFACTFSPDAKEFYYTRLEPGKLNRIYMTRYSDENWTNPVEAPFADSPFDYEPHITPDGKYLLWGSFKMMPGDTVAPSIDAVWLAEKTDSGWTGARPAGNDYMMYASGDLNGNIYYTHNGFWHLDSTQWIYRKPIIARSTLVNGKLSPPGINMPADTALYPGAHPFISPDGSFILFDSNQRDNTHGNTDIYVSFKEPDGAWSEATNLGPAVNTEKDDMCASLSPCGNYMLFARFDNETSDIYWISASVIHKLKK